MMKTFQSVIAVILAGSLCGWTGFQIGNARVPDPSITDGAADSGFRPTILIKPPSSDPEKPTTADRVVKAAEELRRDRSSAGWQSFHAVIDGLEPEELPEVLVRVERMRKGPDRDQLLRVLIPKLAQQDPERTHRYCLRRGLENYMVSIFHAWGQKDPHRAAQALESFMNGGRQNRRISRQANYIHSLVESWSEKDSQAALDWALTLGDQDFMSAARGFWPVFEEGSSAREPFITRVLDLPAESPVGGPYRERLVGMIAETMANEDRESAVAWLRDSGVSSHWMTRTEINMTTFEKPAASADWLYQNIRKGDSSDWFEKMLHIHANWEQRDRGAYLEWLEQKGETDFLDRIRDGGRTVIVP